MTSIKIKELTPETWSDFTYLMQTDTECSNCWCLNHREASCPTGEPAKERMLSLVTDRTARGLLAYDDQTCIGWISVDPMTQLAGHDCVDSAKSGEWSIHCIFVHKEFRGAGVSKVLVDGAIAYARSHGATLISAFPIPPANRHKFPANADFSGRASTFKAFGFKSDGVLSEFYERMELYVD